MRLHTQEEHKTVECPSSHECDNEVKDNSNYSVLSSLEQQRDIECVSNDKNRHGGKGSQHVELALLAESLMSEVNVYIYCTK